MVWFNVCDTLVMHRKARQAGLEALGLWVMAGAWCAQQLADGDVPSWVVDMIGGHDGAVLAKRLEEVGLWEPTAAGWRFHQWEEFQRTREEVLASRAADRRRKQRQRERVRHGVTPAGTDAGTPGGTPGGSHGGSHSQRHAGFPEGLGSSRSSKPFRDSGRNHAVTPAVTPPAFADLCEHGRAGASCPFCARQADQT